MKVKVIRCYSDDTLTDCVNRWLSDYPSTEIIDIKFSSSKDTVAAMIIYKNKE